MCVCVCVLVCVCVSFVHAQLQAAVDAELAAHGQPPVAKDHWDLFEAFIATREAVSASTPLYLSEEYGLPF